jgi:hypothetical protein
LQGKKRDFRDVSRLTAISGRDGYPSLLCTAGDRAISNEKAFDDCVILSEEAFDPDAVFLEDIVDDNVLPYPSLAVEGLTESKDRRKGRLEMRPDDVAANEPISPDTTLPNADLGPDQLDVYGWEPSLWKKIRGYFRF